MNEIWMILGIEPTKDKKEITAAYRAKLSDTNPEDKPEEFKKLRNAYEEALKYAEQADDDSKETGSRLFEQQLNTLYEDFEKRNDPECWKELLKGDFCTGVDTGMIAEESLLRYFMDRYFITHKVWLVLNEQFDWLNRREELYETYPREFIDRVVVAGIRYEDLLPVSMFDPGKDGKACEEYVNLFVKARNTADEEAAEIFEKLHSLTEQHPYGKALELAWKVRQNVPGSFEDFRKLYEEYPEDMQIGVSYLSELYRFKKYDEAEDLCKKLAVINPQYAQVTYIYANVLADTGRKEEGITKLNELMRAAGGDSQRLYELDRIRNEWAKDVIEEKKIYVAEHPEDEDAKADLAWAYLESDRDEEARDLALSINGEKAEPFNYNNLMASISMSFEWYNDALDYLHTLIEVIKNLPEDSDEETRKRKARLGEMYGRLGYVYYMMKDYDKSAEVYEKALGLAKDKSDLLTQLTQISFGKKDYEKAAEYAKKVTAERPDSYHGYFLLAYAYYKLHMDADAFEAVNRSLDYSKTDLGVYILKVRILIRNGGYDAAKEIIEFIDSNNLSEEPSVLFVKGLLKETEEKDSAEALKYYQKAEEALKDKADKVDFSDEMFYRMLCIVGDQSNANKKEDRDKMLEIADKGLACNPDHKGLLDYKAWLLTRAEQNEEALKIYLQLEKDPNHPVSVDEQIGYNYYQDLDHHAEDARRYYLKALERNGHYSAHFYIGMCSMYLGDLEDAEEHFLILQKNEPDMLDSYYRLSFLYERRGELEKALQNAEKVLEIIQSSKDNFVRYYLRKVQILRRLGRPEDAVTTVREIMKKTDYPYGHKMIFDIYVQFGMYDEAQKLMRQRDPKWPHDANYQDAAVTLEFLRNRIFLAKAARANYSPGLDKKRSLVLDHLFAKADEKFAKEIRALEEWLKLEKEGTDGDVSLVLGLLALAYYHYGDTAKQTEYAELTLEEVNKKLSEARLNHLLYKTRKVRALILAGRKREAFELAEECRTHDLCDHCPYHRCKDLDIIEMELNEISGNMSKALESALAGREDWPDEEEFVIGVNMYKKKVK